MPLSRLIPSHKLTNNTAQISGLNVQHIVARVRCREEHLPSIIQVYIV
jgi:hypothetical protein